MLGSPWGSKLSTNNQNPEEELYLKILEKKRSLWRRQGNTTGEGGRRQTRRVEFLEMSEKVSAIK